MQRRQVFGSVLNVHRTSGKVTLFMKADATQTDWVEEWEYDFTSHAVIGRVGFLGADPAGTYREIYYTGLNVIDMTSHPEYYSLEFGATSCPPGEEITTFEECQTAVMSLPNALGSDHQEISCVVVPRFCTAHVHGSGLNQVYFNSASGNPHTNFAPICKRGISSGRRTLMSAPAQSKKQRVGEGRLMM